MPIFIYNSLSRKKEELVPLKPQEIKMYVCGPTVYDQPHIGHARSAYIFDVIRRYLIYRGYKVKFVRNVTDVDDKIIDKAQKEFKGEDLNEAVKKVSAKYLDLYHEDMKSLGILDPDVEPKATEYVDKEKPLMQEFIGQLIKNDCAYVSEGDVYFDIKKAKDYGKLSNQAIDKMEAGSRIALGEKKKDPLDFALWKAAKEGEPSWDSPWGKGRPGWHIECSVMSSDILGDEFDIHGGGLDLIFPHHENEIAQSEGAGKKFARYWIHHGLLTINGQKMSKSLGNFITVKDFLKKYRNADLLKMLFLSTHHSHPVDYTEDKIQEARQSLQRFEGLIDRIIHIKMTSNEIITPGFIEKNEKNFIDAMDNDFNTPQALGCLFELVSDTNRFIETQKDNKDYNAIINNAGSTIHRLAREIFGLSLLRSTEGFSALENNLINIYLDARKEKNYGLADAQRDELRRQGIVVENTKDGLTRFRRL
jgi:cysteinyl-tRNA synthetase